MIITSVNEEPFLIVRGSHDVDFSLSNCVQVSTLCDVFYSVGRCVGPNTSRSSLGALLQSFMLVTPPVSTQLVSEVVTLDSGPVEVARNEQLAGLDVGGGSGVWFQRCSTHQPEYKFSLSCDSLAAAALCTRSQSLISGPVDLAITVPTQGEMGLLTPVETTISDNGSILDPHSLVLAVSEGSSGGESEVVFALFSDSLTRISSCTSAESCVSGLVDSVVLVVSSQGEWTLVFPGVAHVDHVVFGVGNQFSSRNKCIHCGLNC